MMIKIDFEHSQVQETRCDTVDVHTANHPETDLKNFPPRYPWFDWYSD